MILLIRHAEKPANGQMGVSSCGQMDEKSLSVRGWQRTGALAAAVDRLFPAPKHLFASHSSSNRPRETLIPLAEKLGLEINLNYGKGDERELALAARGRHGIVLISWQHEYMKAVATAILGNDRRIPRTWPQDRFDLIWSFELDSSSGLYLFTQVPQLLLKGDLHTGIAT